MRTIILEGKKRKLKATVGGVEEILKKYPEVEDPLDVREAQKLLEDEGRTVQFQFELLWEFIRPRFFFIKPYFTFKRFRKKLDMDDFRAIKVNRVLIFMLYGIEPNEDEDKESKNGMEGSE